MPIIENDNACFNFTKTIIKNDNAQCNVTMSIIKNDNARCNVTMPIIKNDNARCNVTMPIIENDNAHCKSEISFYDLQSTNKTAVMKISKIRLWHSICSKGISKFHKTDLCCVFIKIFP